MNLTIDKVYFNVSREDIFSREFVVEDPEDWILIPCDGLSPMGPCYQSGDAMHDLLDHFKEDQGIVVHELMATGAYVRRMQYVEKQPDDQFRTEQSVAKSMMLMWTYVQIVEREGNPVLSKAPFTISCTSFLAAGQESAK